MHAPIPEARGLPLLGVALRFGPAWALATQRRLGDVFAFRLPGGDGVLLAHPDAVRAALVDTGEIVRQAFPDDPGNLLARATGDGIIALRSDPWVGRRDMMQPSFRRQRLAALVPILRAEVDRLLDELPRRYGRRAFDAQPEMHRLTLTALVRSLFSTSAGTRDIDVAGEAVDLTMRAVSLGPFPLGKGRMLARAERGFDQVADRLIAERRATPPEARPPDLLSAMLEMRGKDGEGLSDRSIRFEIVGLLIAGKETSAITLSWLLALLPQMPDVERRLVDEIDAVLGGRLPEAEDLPRLSYTRMVLSETLRRHTPVWILFPREATEDVIVGPHRIPRGTRVWVSPYVTHHHPAFWDAPEEFCPERFASEDEEPSLKHRYAWLPFGGGPRVCLGNRFAMMEMTLFVARLLARYRVRWAGRRPVEPKVVFTTYFPREVPLELVPRA
jgi:cytochrome P450